MATKSKGFGKLNLVFLFYALMGLQLLLFSAKILHFINISWCFILLPFILPSLILSFGAMLIILTYEYVFFKEKKYYKEK